MSHRESIARHPYQATQLKHQVPRRVQRSRTGPAYERSTSGDSSGGFASPIYHSPLPAVDDDDDDDIDDDEEDRRNVVSDSRRHRPQPHRCWYDGDTTTEHHQRRRSSRRAPSSRSQQRYFYFGADAPVAVAPPPPPPAPFHGRVYPDGRRPGVARRFENERFCTDADVEASRRKYTPVVVVDARTETSDGAHSPASGGLTGQGAVDGCGGHCIAFQNFCYYFLQVAFSIGILAGVSLCIAGSVLRRNRGKDLSVLVYIGCLTSAVCATLLCIQYYVRRNVERRKRALRTAIGAVAAATMIPMAPVAFATAPPMPNPATVVR